MNKTEKTCNSLVFENGAMELTYGMITTEDVKGFPLELGEVGTNTVVAPENSVEAKELAKEAAKLKGQGVRIKTKADAERRIKRGRKVNSRPSKTAGRNETKTEQTKNEGATR